MVAVASHCTIRCDDTDRIRVYAMVYASILYEVMQAYCKVCVHTVGRVGVGEPPPHSPHKALVTRLKINIVVKYIGRRNWMEGELTDSRVYQITTPYSHLTPLRPLPLSDTTPGVLEKQIRHHTRLPRCCSTIKVNTSCCTVRRR